jgi:hypothetical protein
MNKDQRTVSQRNQENTKTTAREEELENFSTSSNSLVLSLLSFLYGRPAKEKIHE